MCCTKSSNSSRFFDFIPCVTISWAEKEKQEGEEKEEKGGRHDEKVDSNRKGKERKY